MSDQQAMRNDAWESGATLGARVEDLIITEIKDEVLVYDNRRHHIHHLNRVMASVWRLCDGRRSVGDIAAEIGQPGDAGNEIVRVALSQLADARLLDGAPPRHMHAVRRSRRGFVRRMTIGGAIAVPMIASMTAPTAAQQASTDPPMCTPAFGRCDGGQICCSNLSCQSFVTDPVNGGQFPYPVCI